MINCCNKDEEKIEKPSRWEKIYNVLGIIRIIVDFTSGTMASRRNVYIKVLKEGIKQPTNLYS